MMTTMPSGRCRSCGREHDDDVHARAESRRAWRSESGGSAVARHMLTGVCLRAPAVNGCRAAIHGRQVDRRGVLTSGDSWRWSELKILAVVVVGCDVRTAVYSKSS
jgi:hypothetical protein